MSVSLRPLRIGFIHPDLGIGGAERLVVDAACGLQDLGHHVHIYTSHWEKERCFEETHDGTLGVTVLGDSLPISFRHKFHILFAILRQVHLALSLLWRTYFSSSFIPPDLYIVDQLSACIPILRWFGRTRVIFYCHFPDLLLSPGRSGYASGQPGTERKSLLRAVYRAPVDALEEATTGQADRILVNSRFTATTFNAIFPEVRNQLQIVYPGIRAKDYAGDSPPDELVGTRPTLLSLNRFEEKKNVSLALDAFALALKGGKVPSDLRLVIAGGYDSRVDNCVYTLRALQRLADDHKLTHSTTNLSAQVLFLTNLPEHQKLALLKASNTRALLYTPSFEHLGIVPLEAMACGLPVIAVDNGGPLETVIDGETGFLRPAKKAEWAEAIVDLVNLDKGQREHMASAGRKRVNEHFDVKVLARNFESAVRGVLQDVETSRVGDIWTEVGTLKAVLGSFMTFLCALSIAAMLYYRGV